MFGRVQSTPLHATTYGRELPPDSFHSRGQPCKCPEFLQRHILETRSITPQIPYSKREAQSQSRYELDLVLIRVRSSFGWNLGVCDCFCGCLWMNEWTECTGRDKYHSCSYGIAYEYSTSTDRHLPSTYTYCTGLA